MNPEITSAVLGFISAVGYLVVGVGIVVVFAAIAFATIRLALTAGAGLGDRHR